MDTSSQGATMQGRPRTSSVAPCPTSAPETSPPSLTAGGVFGDTDRHMQEDGPSVLTMIGAVALIVALVILVFFAAGYGFGRLFL